MYLLSLSAILRAAKGMPFSTVNGIVIILKGGSYLPKGRSFALTRSVQQLRRDRLK
jgi:hypothetical protein